MSVRIRMKKMGRKHRPFYRICAMDIRRPRDGRVLEELGTYDPMVPETDARAMLNGERINYWLGVGATAIGQGAGADQEVRRRGDARGGAAAALARLAESRRRPEPMAPMPRAPKPARRPRMKDGRKAPPKRGRSRGPAEAKPRRPRSRPTTVCRGSEAEVTAPEVKTEPAAQEQKADRRQCDSTF